MSPRQATFRSARHGSVTLETILAVPVLVIALLGVYQFANLSVMQAAISHAATVGAREAGKGGDVNEVAYAVQNVLAANCIVISDAPDSGTVVVLEDGLLGVTSTGDPNLTCTPPAVPLAADEVRVTLCIRVEATPVCDPLNTFGFSVFGRCFRASAVVKKEVWP